MAYRVVSNDGHPITGVISFSYPETVATESEPSTEATTEDSPAAVPSDQSSTVQDTPEPELISVESTDDEPTSGISPIWLIIIGLGIGAVIGFVMLKRGASRASKN